MRWFWRCLVLLAAPALLAALAVPAAAAPAPLHRIVAVGDLHGDFAAWRAIARDAGLVDKDGRWSGGDAVLVQTGDVVDRGPDSLKIIQDLMRLQGEASRAHGQVIALVGNHEAMNLTGDLRYVSPADYAAYADNLSGLRRENIYYSNRTTIEASYHQKTPGMSGGDIKKAWLDTFPLGRIEHQIAWSDRGKIGPWIVKNPAIVELDGFVFLHGGISPAYVHTSIADMNAQVAAALAARSTDPAAIINADDGPLWYRGLAPDGDLSGEPRAEHPADPPPVENQLDAVLSAYGAKAIVIGHTPILSGIAMLYGGKLIRIDTGISAVYGGTVSYLDIRGGKPVPHSVERPTQPVKQGVP